MVDAEGGRLGHVGISLAFGLVVMAMVYAFAHVSGAHINPAVTLSLATRRRLSWASVPGYWGAQVTGAIAAASRAARLPRRRCESRRDDAVRIRCPVVRLGAPHDWDAPRSDPGCRNRHPRVHRGCCGRDRRDDRPRIARRRPDLRGVAEPRALRRVRRLSPASSARCGSISPLPCSVASSARSRSTSCARAHPLDLRGWTTQNPCTGRGEACNERGFRAAPETRQRRRATVVTGHRPVPSAGRGRTRGRPAARLGATRIERSRESSRARSPAASSRSSRSPRADTSSSRAAGSWSRTFRSTISSRCSSTCPSRRVVCTHREVFEKLLGWDVTCEKGGAWVLERNGPELVPALYLAPPAAVRAAERHTARTG